MTECTEYRAKQISEAKKGKVPNRVNYAHSKETCKKISEGNLGKKMPPHTAKARQAIGKAVNARYAAMTKEEKYELAKRSFSSPESWTDERKAKISKALTGKIATTETRAKMSISKRKFNSELTDNERIEKYGKHNKGKSWKLVNGNRVWMDKE